MNHQSPPTASSPYFGWRTSALCATALLALLPVQSSGQQPVAQAAYFQWLTVANSADVIPGSDGRRFNSFNQPSVSTGGLVVMRARSKGGSPLGEPIRGIYARAMSGPTNPITMLMDNQTAVPAPNNLSYNGSPTTFTEFPAFARVSASGTTVLTRAQSQPVWTYSLSDGTEARIGTSGLYAHQLGQRVTVMSQLGVAPGFEFFAVPGAAPGTRFDQFPGAPANVGVNGVAFKGNYADVGVPKTGVFVRNFPPKGPASPAFVIANSDRLIPGQPAGGVRFGSTAPPSASDKHVVFLGVDNEASPSLGGIYRAPLAPLPPLEALVTINGPVPDEPTGTVFTRLGESLSFDGRFVAFWGAWGTDKRVVTIVCPSDGQSAVIASCLAQHPTGSTTVQVPTNQGFFVHDAQTRKTWTVMKTGGEWSDFLYWTFSGRPPGVGESDAEDFEEPRWRSAAFVAVEGKSGSARVVFKARRSVPQVIDGLYLASLPYTAATVSVVAETHSDARALDMTAPAGSVITSLGLERDGLRGGWLAIAVGMLNTQTSESWAGVYVTRTER